MRNHIIIPVAVALILRGAYRYLLPTSLRANICPLFACVRELAACVQKPTCSAVLDCIKECDDEDGDRRRESREKFAHVQFPADPNLCRYQCFDLIVDDEAERFISCVGGSGCLEIEPAASSDTCAAIPQNNVLPFSAVPQDVFEGRWKKMLSNSWDLWPCQRTEFFAPHNDEVLPLPWMEEWPSNDNVWRMDLNWTVGAGTGRTFTMTNELTPGARWNYTGGTSAHPTARTRAIMWGTTAHENWYFLDYNEQYHSLLMHVCAYTPAVRSFDAITMVIVKEGVNITPDLLNYSRERAQEILGTDFGTLQRIEGCKTGYAS